MPWVSPTGFSDPDNDWEDEPFAYDDDILTYAWEGIGGGLAGAWGSFLHLTIAEITSNKLRYMAGSSLGQISQVDVDVFKDGVWVHVYEGAIGIGWQEKTFTQGQVTEARIRFWCPRFITDTAFLYEFDFWVPPPVVWGGSALPQLQMAKTILDL